MALIGAFRSLRRPLAMQAVSMRSTDWGGHRVRDSGKKSCFRSFSGTRLPKARKSLNSDPLSSGDNFWRRDAGSRMPPASIRTIGSMLTTTWSFIKWNWRPFSKLQPAEVPLVTTSGGELEGFATCLHNLSRHMTSDPAKMRHATARPFFETSSKGETVRAATSISSIRSGLYRSTNMQRQIIPKAETEVTLRVQPATTLSLRFFKIRRSKNCLP